MGLNLSCISSCFSCAKDPNIDEELNINTKQSLEIPKFKKTNIPKKPTRSSTN